METTIFSNTGQLVIPASVRELHRWQVGTEFTVEGIPLGVLLKPKKPFPESRLKDRLGCLEYKDPPLDMEAIKRLLDEAVRRIGGKI